MKHGVTVATLALLTLVSTVHAGHVTSAEDNASNYTNWVSGSNGGFGLDNWLFRTSGTSGGFKGGFLADNNTAGLNYIRTMPGFKAWGTFANKGDEPQHMVAFRGFGWNDQTQTWDNKLDEPKETFLVSMENGGIDMVVPGRAGFTLRNGNTDTATGDYLIGRRFEFGFRGGDAHYYVIDASGTVDTGINWRDSGLDLRFMLETTNTYSFTIGDAKTGSVLTNMTGTLVGAGSIDSVALFNRDSKQNDDVFFNKLRLEVYREPTVMIFK